MPLVERNHRVEQLAAAAPHPTLGNTILPGTFEGGPRGVRGDLVRPPGCARGWSAYAEDRYRTLLRLSMRTTETDQSFRAVLSGESRVRLLKRRGQKRKRAGPQASCARLDGRLRQLRGRAGRREQV